MRSIPSEFSALLINRDISSKIATQSSSKKKGRKKKNKETDYSSSCTIYIIASNRVISDIHTRKNMYIRKIIFGAVLFWWQFWKEYLFHYMNFYQFKMVLPIASTESPVVLYNVYGI